MKQLFIILLVGCLVLSVAEDVKQFPGKRERTISRSLLYGSYGLLLGGGLSENSGDKPAGYFFSGAALARMSQSPFVLIGAEYERAYAESLLKDGDMDAYSRFKIHQGKEQVRTAVEQLTFGFGGTLISFGLLYMSSDIGEEYPDIMVPLSIGLTVNSVGMICGSVPSFIRGVRNLRKGRQGVATLEKRQKVTFIPRGAGFSLLF